MGGHRQDRPHPHAGRDAADARPGMVRLCRHARRTTSSGGARAAGVYRLALGGTAVGTGHQRGAGLRRGRGGGDRPAHRPALRHARRTSSPCRARTTRWYSSPARCGRWPCRSTRSPTTFGCCRCGPRCGFARADHPGERARLVDHAGQGEPDPVRGAGDDRGAGDGATTSRSGSAAPRAIWR